MIDTEAGRIVMKARREVTDLRTRFQLLRIADIADASERETLRMLQHQKTRKAASVKAARTRKHNADPFGFKAASDQRLADALAMDKVSA